MTLTDTSPPVPRRPRPCAGRRWRRHAAAVVAALVVLLAFPTVSYARALTYPGHATVTERTVEWVRDSGGGWLVDVIENWWFGRGPSASAPASASLPTTVASMPSAATPPPASLAPLRGAAPVAGEGVWTAGPTTRSGRPVMWTTFVRPDPQHPGVVAGVAHMDAAVVAFRSIPGTSQPVRDPEQVAAVPAGLRSAMVATFNSGFKTADAQGGLEIAGTDVAPMRQGAASVVVRTDGSLTVGSWGHDVKPGPDVASVRQNLDLVVEHGTPVAGVDTNADGRWGTAKNQLQCTWRSGIGVDARGDVIYVGGDQMTLATLGAALARAGVVTGMQLDIHPGKVEFFSYTHPASGGVHTTRLLPDMSGPINRYLVQDQRDFFMVTVR